MQRGVIYYTGKEKEIDMKTMEYESRPEVSNILSKAQQWQEDVKETAQNATRATAHYIEENPWKAIAVVAVCALALGFLLRVGSD